MKPRTEDVQRHLEWTFIEFGLPRWMLSDNGPPFGSNGLGGLSRLGVWLLEVGVKAVFIEPGHPEQNGSHERFHRTLKLETASPPGPTIRSQQARFDRFRRVFDEERPHEALDMRCPADLHALAARREMPSRLEDFEYGSSAQARRVRTDGSIKWSGRLVFLGTAMCGELVGIEPREDGALHVFLGPARLGVLVEDSGVIVPMAEPHG